MRETERMSEKEKEIIYLDKKEIMYLDKKETLKMSNHENETKKMCVNKRDKKNVRK